FSQLRPSLTSTLVEKEQKELMISLTQASKPMIKMALSTLTLILKNTRTMATIILLMSQILSQKLCGGLVALPSKATIPRLIRSQGLWRKLPPRRRLMTTQTKQWT
ncbi:hypothetical protein BGX27_006473, partial [Mortierella sp. AM989]